ncbi:MAG: cysteine hydrolase [Propionivibrio sp.]
MAKLHLLIIDPQNDFCDLPDDYLAFTPGGGRLLPALPVAGAHADMRRLAGLIDAGRSYVDAITVTLDSHQHFDIAHPTFWQRASGEAIVPFTEIEAADLRAGRVLPRDAELRERVQAYLDALELAGRYTHMVWPVHCEIGTWGHNIHFDLHAALNRWEEAHATYFAKVTKGENPLTEHYSALQAEIPVADDPATQLNRGLLARLRQSDRIYIAGEAGSHCVRATVEHLVANWPVDSLSRLVLIRDCISAVTGFEAAYAEFLAGMGKRGLRAMSAAEVRAEWAADADRVDTEQVHAG